MKNVKEIGNLVHYFDTTSLPGLQIRISLFLADPDPGDLKYLSYQDQKPGKAPISKFPYKIKVVESLSFCMKNGNNFVNLILKIRITGSHS